MTASMRDLLETCPVDALVTNAHVDEFVAWFEEQGYDLVRREPSAGLTVTASLSLEHLRHFEVGYDREYIGVGLHCLVCPKGDYGSHWGDGAYLDWKPLTEVAELAMRHLREHHPELVEAS